MVSAISQRRFWSLVRRQHGVISLEQLLTLGFSRRAVEYRIARGRLFPLFKGVYVVGRPHVGRHGLWLAAVLACGEGAVLSHESAAQLLGFWPLRGEHIHLSLMSGGDRRHPGITVHRRSALRSADKTEHDRIPVTSAACTLVDLAARYGRTTTERAVNEADQAGVISAEKLYEEVAAVPAGRRGTRALLEILEPGAFVLTASELEQLFVPIALRAGLPLPLTGQWVNGFEVDFYWPDLGLVVEADSGRFHRTPTQQRNDRRRDHAHAKAGMTPLRFTHHQIAREPGYVEATLRDVARRLAA